MKKNFIVYTFIIFVLTSLTIFAEREVDFEKLEYDEKTELLYVEGEKEAFTGIAKYYSKDESSIFEFPYKNGKKEGRGKEYYLNGKFKSDAFFIDGLLQGKSIGYYENGNLEYEENYKDGKLEGESTNYDENGNLTSKAIYKDDEIVENLFGDTEEDTSSKNNKLKGYTGPIILCGLIGLYVFLTAYKKLKSFPKTSHLTDEQRSRIFKILMKHDEGNKELFSSYTLNGVGSSYYRVASMMVDNEKVYIYAKMLSFVYLPTPITFGYLFGYSKDHILASYSNATFKEVKKEIEETILHM